MANQVIDEELCKKCKCSDCEIQLNAIVNGQKIKGKCKTFSCSYCKKTWQLLCTKCDYKK